MCSAFQEDFSKRVRYSMGRPMRWKERQVRRDCAFGRDTCGSVARIDDSRIKTSISSGKSSNCMPVLVVKVNSAAERSVLECEKCRPKCYESMPEQSATYMFIILDNVYEDGRISISHPYYSNYRILAAKTTLSSPRSRLCESRGGRFTTI